eukprot:TRINITY_DN17487_c0_g1_i4.p1 TRINITY_DN17487_c0_g1~~TRINITY_DN17487_c0_g1_i4.p1  ORF type:complete len:106 (-),score=6.42 TRINITY_DN17487_c0_g1_i4:562-879(-)
MSDDHVDDVGLKHGIHESSERYTIRSKLEKLGRLWKDDQPSELCIPRGATRTSGECVRPALDLEMANDCCSSRKAVESDLRSISPCLANLVHDRKMHQLRTGMEY